MQNSLNFRFIYREATIDNTSAVQIFENNVICTQNSRPQIFKFTNCFDASATNVNQKKINYLKYHYSLIIQKNVYDGMIRPAVLAALQGI